ncbi:MAG: DUF1858 domain-containing protein [Candidatus Cloacimonadota bacterium]|nr:MAG: DUF1858 domain-containing protein [Candidatus Cloacimonadota bacterium]
MITKDMWIEEILDKYSDAQKFLSEHGIVCVMCGEPVWGSLQEQMEEKGFSKDEQDNLVKELNEYLISHKITRKNTKRY